MKVLIEITVLGKVQTTWEKDGKAFVIPKVNYSQDDGQIVGQLKVPEEVYNSVEVAKKYILEADVLQEWALRKVNPKRSRKMQRKFS